MVQSYTSCVHPFRLPGTSITVEAGTMVTVPTWSLHRDPLYWSNPEEFLPQRFLPENKDKIITGTYLPFGLGPRNCIGELSCLPPAGASEAGSTAQDEQQPLREQSNTVCWWMFSAFYTSVAQNSPCFNFVYFQALPSQPTCKG